MHVAGEISPGVVLKVAIIGELLDCFAHFIAKGVVAHLGTRVSENCKGRGQLSIEREAIQRGEKLAFREIAVGTENYDRALRDTAFETERIGEGVL
jgi:hypothetical protein